MKQLILHIPHSSTKIPYKDGFIIDDKLLSREITKLTDWYTDDLFYSKDDISIVAGYSRIFCDPERFVDDKEEIMAKYGMGVLYERVDNGLKMRNINPALRERIIKEFYLPHHKKLLNAVSSHLNMYGEALIIDCHSFPDIPFERDLNKEPNRPDINIGTDKFHTPQQLIDFTTVFFESHNLSVGIDWPYSGTIVPLEYYGKDKRVKSIMIEINRKLYLEEGTNNKLPVYNRLKRIIGDYLKEIMLVNNLDYM
ncbi:MAG: N-formylglutamate amidohydrolase [Bacteroidota bacterium]